MRQKFPPALLAIVLMVLLCAGLNATKLVHMNLEQLCQRSDRIITGTVVAITEESVEAGGGLLPALNIKVQVDRAFKGQFETVKDTQIAEFKMIGTLKQLESGRPPIPGMPVLQTGKRYLLMIAPDGPVGVTSTMGLAQGCFAVSGKVGSETAMNGFGNAGLFRGMSVQGMPSRGPVDYATLANLITSIVEGGN